MQTFPKWHIEIAVERREPGPETAAVVLLRLPDETELSAHGQATGHPHDQAPVTMADQLAVAAALNDLAGQLVRIAGRHAR